MNVRRDEHDTSFMYAGDRRETIGPMKTVGCSIVYVTASTESEAVGIGEALISERLAAAVNIVHSVRSLFRWRDRVEDKAECLMVIKTRRSLVDQLIDRTTALHGYEVPCVIATPIVAGSSRYLNWIQQVTREPSQPDEHELRDA